MPVAVGLELMVVLRDDFLTSRPQGGVLTSEGQRPERADEAPKAAC